MRSKLLAMPWFASLLLAAGCTCENSEVTSSTNGTGEFRAVLFERNCGATTDFSTQVSVLKAGQLLPNEAGNVFVADTNGGAAKAESWGGPYAAIKWADAKTLVVSFDDAAEVFKKVEELAGVIVLYSPVRRQ